MNICTIEDTELDAGLTGKIRNLLYTCFPYEPKFQDRLFLNEKPDFRYIVYEEEQLIAHSAVYEKKIRTTGTEEFFIGIGEVCVVPGYRKQGITKRVLSRIERDYSNTTLFMLLGSLLYYRSSGYEKKNNVYFTSIPEDPSEFVLVKVRPGFIWPVSEKVFVEGLPF